ncbi:helix-turn-helix domain-containing protein [Bosea sp. (in: a-proteobacteria)]|uniref:helix-turn-helix domain-containing protein n=1 Tax=Bosea sp. (in: a-proteobacteria) TaxID=1871050 RepID=UPI003F6E70FA
MAASLLAAEQPRLAPPTISVQIGKLKEALGTALFHRARRRLELTVPGQLALEPSLRFDTYDHLIEAACQAWNNLIDQPIAVDGC